MKGKFLLFLIVLSAWGCSPRVIENTVTRTEVVYRDRVQRDTTFLHDSTFVREYIKGDTVRIIEYRDRYHYDYKYIYRTDTLILRDSVAVERIKEVKVEKDLSFCESVKIGAFWWLLGAVLCLGCWTFRKPLGSLLKAALPIVRNFLKI